VQKKHLGRNLREWKRKVRGSKKVSLLELEEKAEVDVDDLEMSNETQLVTKKDLFAKLKWAEIVPEWGSLDEYQKKLAEDSIWAKLNPAQKKLAISALVNWKATEKATWNAAAAQNYINYCLDPSSLSLETEKAKVMKLMKSGEPFFANEVSINLSISLRRAQLILHNFYKKGALVRHPTGDKGAFCYRIGGEEARDQSCDFEKIKAYIENVSPYRRDILSHFNEIPQNVIDRAIKWMRKTHALGSLWCLERKQTYYKIGCETLTVRELHKELLLQQFAEHGPSTIFAVHKRVEQREATLRKAAHELLEEGKIVVMQSSSRTTVYGLAEGMEKCVEQMAN
jgi:predicted transcriptional regulator